MLLKGLTTYKTLKCDSSLNCENKTNTKRKKLYIRTFLDENNKSLNICNECLKKEYLNGNIKIYDLMNHRDLFKQLVLETTNINDLIEFNSPMGSGETTFRYLGYNNISGLYHFINDVEERALSLGCVLDTQYKIVVK